METSPIPCGYKFTASEFERAYGSYRRAVTPPRAVQVGIFAVVALSLNFVVGSLLLLIMADAPTHIRLSIMTGLNALLLLSLGVTLLLDLFAGERAHPALTNFKKMAPVDDQLFYSLESDGLSVIHERYRRKRPWTSISEWIETETGFVLAASLERWDFIWLPFSGFKDLLEIDAARELLKANVPKGGLLY